MAYIIQFAQGGTTAKGQKGEEGQKGQKGEQNDKGQKGASGDKGAASSVQGPTGDKGQKGEVGVTGDKGATGATGAKGQKGEVGVAGSDGSDGSAGSDGSDGDKGQKGEVGAAGTLATAVVKKVRTATLSGTVYYTSVGSGNWTNACEIPSFTPNSANSVFLVNINIGEFSRYSGSGAATGEMRIRDANGNGSIDSIETFRSTGDFAGHTATGLSFSLIDLRGGTSNRNYQVQLNDGNNAGVPQVKNIRMMCIELDTSV